MLRLFEERYADDLALTKIQLIEIDLLCTLPC